MAGGERIGAHCPVSSPACGGGREGVLRMTDLDPITLALVQNRLDYIARQMGWVMTRTARSPIFNQSHDFSCFIADPEGTKPS